MQEPTGELKRLMDNWVAFVVEYWNNFEVPVLSRYVHQRFGFGFHNLGMRADAVRVLLQAHRMLQCIMTTRGTLYYMPISRWDELSTAEQDYLMLRLERGECKPVPKRYSAAQPSVSTPFSRDASGAVTGPIQFTPGVSMRAFDSDAVVEAPELVAPKPEVAVDTFDVGAMPVTKNDTSTT